MDAMKTALVLLMICIGTAFSLSCYTCVNAASNCLSATTNCTSGETFCKTETTSASVGGLSVAVITKSCASACTPVSLGFSAASSSVSCCSTDLCNTSGAGSIKSSVMMYCVTAGLVLALLRKAL